MIRPIIEGLLGIISKLLKNLSVRLNLRSLKLLKDGTNYFQRLKQIPKIFQLLMQRKAKPMISKPSLIMVRLSALPIIRIDFRHAYTVISKTPSSMTTQIPNQSHYRSIKFDYFQVRPLLPLSTFEPSFGVIKAW